MGDSFRGVRDAAVTMNDKHPQHHQNSKTKISGSCRVFFSWWGYIFKKIKQKSYFLRCGFIQNEQMKLCQ